jgi:hypothetical protein
MTRALTLAGLMLAIFAAGWLQGRAGERAAGQARAAALLSERDRAALRAEALAALLETERRDRAALALRLEEAADADDDADRMALPARSLRRIDAR